MESGDWREKGCRRPGMERVRLPVWKRRLPPPLKPRAVQDLAAHCGSVLAERRIRQKRSHLAFRREPLGWHENINKRTAPRPVNLMQEPRSRGSESAATSYGVR